MEIISSKDNGRVKNLKKLFSDKELRYQTATFPTEGVRLTGEAVRLGLPLLSLFVGQTALSRGEEAISALIKEAGEVYHLPDKLIDTLGDTRTPQGVIGLFGMPAPTAPSLFGPAILLCHLQDPGNVGAILRTCAAFGLQCALTSDCPDPYSPKLLRASMGGVLGGNWFFVQSPEGYISDFKAAGGRVLAAALCTDGVRLGSENIADALVLLGSEGNGLPQSYIAAAGESLYIPILKRAESLNVAVAAGVIAYEMTRGGAL